MPTVSIDGVKTPITEGSSGMAPASIPNICKMPGPPAPFVPVPLPNIGQSGKQPQGYSTSVKIEGKAVAITGATFGSSGDVASKGSGGGLISSNAEGITTFVAPGALDVQIEGKNVQLLGDQVLNNGAPGGTPPNAATMAGVLQAPGSAASEASASDSDSDDDSTELELKIWLLDDFGERMDGAPYRLEMGEEIRVGTADGDGLLTESDLPDFPSAKLQWGMLDEVAEGTPPPEDEGDADQYFLFTQRVYFAVDLDDSGGVRRQLFNLGYVGSEDDQRSEFGVDYGANEDSDIDGVHGSGKPWAKDDDDDDDSDDDDSDDDDSDGDDSDGDDDSDGGYDENALALNAGDEDDAQDGDTPTDEDEAADDDGEETA
jgi:hypothetical protein